MLCSLACSPGFAPVGVMALARTLPFRTMALKEVDPRSIPMYVFALDRIFTIKYKFE